MTDLTAGDLALISYSADSAGANQKGFAFVLLKPVDAGTTINFTDDGWLAAGGFRTGEGVLTWTAGAGGATAGTVISFTGQVGTFNLSTTGDSIIAYQGALTTPHALFALHVADNHTAFDADATNSNTSAIPTGLTLGTTALAFGPDNGAYTGPTTDTAANLLHDIGVAANWTTNDATSVAFPASFTVTDAAGAGATVSVADVSQPEGDVDNAMTFTVTRSDTTTAFSVNYATHDGTATAGSDYDAASGTLTFAAGGPATQTVTVNIHGDTVVEGDEKFTVSLSNVTNTTGATTLGAATGTGTILNDDVALVHTYDIQGASHTSPLNGQHVFTEGVVTAIDTTGAKGFYIQDPTGDGNDATSDAVFVFTNSAVTVHTGDLVRVEGNVTEFQGSDPNNLTITELDSDNAHITDEGVGPAIAPTIIGDGGRHAPTEVIDSDHFTVFNPGTDAADFYESLEGMLVTVKNAQVTTASFTGETFVVPDDGLNTGMNDRGGITISPGDMNPETIELFNDTGVANVPLNNVAGDHLGDVTGVVSYFGGNYEVIPLSVQSTASAGAASRETTTLTGDASHLTIGEYNLDNLDGSDPTAAARINALASDIVHNLGSPNIIGVEEIADNVAAVAAGSTDYSGTATLQKLVDSIAAAGEPHYAFASIAPTVNGANGGEPNGNIRQAFLYDTSKVTLVDGSLHQIQDDNLANGDAYSTSRHPLVGDFVFNGETVTVVDVHDSARSGSDEQFGVDQPPVNSDDSKRTDQTAPIEHFVQQTEAANPNAHIIVTGDFNGFQFETAQTQLTTGGILTNLDTLLDPTDRYSYNFDGDDEEIDHMYASPSLASGAQFDIVHLNTGQSDASRDTDHDPTLGRFLVDMAPTAVNDAAAANDHQSVTINVTANDTDPNPGDVQTVTSVSATSAGGHVSIVGGQVVYTADADAFDKLTPTQHATDTFTYVIQDQGGETSSATVSVTVTGIANGPNQTGGAANDSLTGTIANEKIDGGAGNDTIDAGSGADTVIGGLGDDKLMGGAGADSISAGAGNDTVIGGAGNDALSGATGNDLFVFQPGFGHDVVADFQAGLDKIEFQGVSGFSSFADVQAHAAQSGINVLITDTAGDTVQLNNVQLSSLHSTDFLFA